MKWSKQGLIFDPHGRVDWLKSHAQVPTALVKESEGIVRVYFSGRPDPKTSMTGFVDLDINNLQNIVYTHPEPILQLGTKGTFDEHGIMPSCAVEKDGIIYLYYSGWSRGHSLPYSNFTGIAISEDGGKTFIKYSRGPVLDRTPQEIYSATSPYVMEENGTWHMWYCSGTHWHEIDGQLEHTYDIKYASSSNGLNWTQTNKTAIAQSDPSEAITRPSVCKITDQYHMWYCYRGSHNFRNGDDGYRIGHAISDDLHTWERIDSSVTLPCSENGWDSIMLAYPSVFCLSDQLYMLYNGNAFGREGFGLAKMETD